MKAARSQITRIASLVFTAVAILAAVPPTIAASPLFGAAYLPIETGGGPAAVGDLNGDGKPDLVTVNFDPGALSEMLGTVSVMLGRGDGTFDVKKVPSGEGAGP